MCLVAAGNTIVATCGVKSGIKAGNIWWGNLVDITLTVANGVATAITMAASTNLYRLEMNKKGNNISHTFVPNDYGSGDYTHTGDLRSVENKAALKKLIEGTIGAKIVLFEQGQDGTFLVAGYDNGLSLNKDDFSMADDALGHTWALTSENEPGPLLHLLLTDEATTLAGLVALEA